MIIVGDLHCKNKEPYKSAVTSFFQWLAENYSQETIIFLGDLFDSSSPHNEVRYDVTYWLKQFNFVTILTGNHDISKKMGNTLIPLSHFMNIEVIEEAGPGEVDGLNCMFLPYKHGNIKEEYEALTGKYDYIFTHITPPECQFGDEGMTLQMEGQYIHGHTHIQTDFKNTKVLGVPIPTRHLEEAQAHRILEIKGNKFEFIDVPQFFTFETVTYGEDPKDKNNILNIIEAPSIQSVYDKYKDYYIRKAGIKLQRTELDLDDEEMEIFDSANQQGTKERFVSYAKEVNLDTDVLNCVLKYLDK